MLPVLLDRITDRPFAGEARPARRWLPFATRAPKSPLMRSVKSVNLALQGGGAHGAFTWGVLDRLLEEDIDIGRISGSSAGALNGAALATGLARLKRQGTVKRYLMESLFAYKQARP